MKLDALRSVPLFRALDEESALELCDLLTMRDVPAGDLRAVWNATNSTPTTRLADGSL